MPCRKWCIGGYPIVDQQAAYGILIAELSIKAADQNKHYTIKTYYSQH